MFVRAVHETGLPVTISKGGRQSVDARSLLEVMTEDFHCGCTVELAVDPAAVPDRYSPDDVEKALDGLRALLESARPR
jgi:phosphocarrier protein